MRPPDAVLRLMRARLVATLDPHLVAAELKTHPHTVKRWNRKFGWVRLPKGPRTGPWGALPYSGPRPKQWRCTDCSPGGVVNLEPKCVKCGSVPTWAQKAS